MKATRLRVDIVLAVVTLLLAGAIFVPATVHADGDALKDALHDYAKGDYDSALGKLRSYVQSNPENQEVYAVLLETEERVLLDALAKGGEHERLIKYLLGKAKPIEAEGPGDDEIKAKVDEAVNSREIDVQRAARGELRAAGGRAVPHLAAYLTSENRDVVVNAILALRQLGPDAAVPLAEVLGSDNARARGYAATVLGDIGDPRGLPAVHAAAQGDSDVGVQAKASKALAHLGGGQGSAADSYVALGMRYYTRDVTVIAAFDDVKDMWRWEDGGVARYDVPAYLYPYQMAEECAADALAIDPGHKGAAALLVRALLAQRVEAEVLTSNGGSAPESLGGAFGLAESLGFDAASAALAGALEGEDWDVAVECCYLVAATYGGEDLLDHPLGLALDAPQKRVRYAAAIAALRISPKRNLPNADKVVSLGAQAASESAIRQALVVDPNHETRSKLVMALSQGGVQASGSAMGTDGVMRAKMAPSLDVVVVRADLDVAEETIPSERHSSAYMVIDELIADARTKGMKIIVLVQDTSEAKADAIKEGFQAKYGDKVHGFIAVPLVEAVAVSAVNAALDDKELNVDQERANKLAATAADAFAKVDFSCKSFDLTVAIDPLSTAATSGPTPEVQLNATRALGNLRVGGGDALLKVLTDGEGDALKAAAAKALGNVLSAIDGTPEQIAGLMDASKAGGDVGKAALAALGQVRNLTPEQRLDVFNTHRLQVGEKGN